MFFCLGFHGRILQAGNWGFLAKMWGLEQKIFSRDRKIEIILLCCVSQGPSEIIVMIMTVMIVK